MSERGAEMGESTAAGEGRTPPAAREAHGMHEEHVSNRTYIGVAAVLAVLTALEVMVFYVPALDPVLVPILVSLMVVKFALVVMFFMHLRFDSRIFSGVFLGSLVIATSVVLAMLLIHGAFPGGGSG